MSSDEKNDICSGQFCQKGSRLTILEKRVSDLEKSEADLSEFQKFFYQSREAQIKRDTEIDFKMKSMDGKLDSMNTKLDNLSEWKAEQDNKPNKFLDNMKDKIFGAIAAAIGGGIITAVVYLIITLSSAV